MLRMYALFLLFFIHSICRGQSLQVENLVFEGGGLRGIAYIGALQQLEEFGIVKQIHRVGGNSAGAIMALMVSLGYTADEIYVILSKVKPWKMKNGHFLFMGLRYSLSHHYGWYNSRKINHLLEKIIADKTGNADISFAELTASGYKELSVMSTCVTKQKAMVLSAKNYPNMKVKDAVLISCSVPIVYQAVFVDSVGKIYTHQNKQGNLDIFIDGLITGNYPISMFDGLQIEAPNKVIRIPNYKTLGIQITSEKQMQNDNLGNGLLDWQVTGFGDYMKALVCYIFESLNRQTMTCADWERTISLPTLGIGPQLKKLSPEKTIELIRAGKEFTRKYLEEREGNIL